MSVSLWQERRRCSGSGILHPDKDGRDNFLPCWTGCQKRYQVSVNGSKLCGSEEKPALMSVRLFSKPLELKIGTLQFFPDAMRHFQRDVHDCLVLDGWVGWVGSGWFCLVLFFFCLVFGFVCLFVCLVWLFFFCFVFFLFGFVFFVWFCLFVFFCLFFFFVWFCLVLFFFVWFCFFCLVLFVCVFLFVFFLFGFVWFCFFLFGLVWFCFVLFRFVSLCFVCFVLFCYVMFCFVLFVGLFVRLFVCLFVLFGVLPIVSWTLFQVYGKSVPFPSMLFRWRRASLKMVLPILGPTCELGSFAGIITVFSHGLPAS